MRVDELERALRRAADAQPPVGDRRVAIARRVRRPRVAIAGGGAAAVAAVVVALVALAPWRDAATPQRVVTEPPPTTTSTLAPTRGFPAGFQPGSVTFVSVTTGWVLGRRSACEAAVACTATLLRTDDATRTWHVVGDAPAGGIRFANRNDGWVFGEGLWSTHDGGRHWAPILLDGSTPHVFDLAAGDGTVHVTIVNKETYRLEVFTASVGSDTWARSATTTDLGAAPVPDAKIVLEGSRGWIVVVNRTEVGGLRLHNGQWTTWQPPCKETGGLEVLAASTPTELVALCKEGDWFGPPNGPHLYVSHDGGDTFTRLPARVPGFGLLATPTPGVEVIAATGSDGTSHLFRSTDGATWTTVATGRTNATWSYLGFTTTTNGVAIEIAGVSGTSWLLRTTDGGRTWVRVG